MKSIIAQKILLSMDMPGGIVGPILNKFKGKKINVKEMKELVLDLVSAIEHDGDKDKVSDQEVEELWEDMKDNAVWDAMGIKVPTTHIKYASEDSDLKFASEDEAVQFLSDELGKKVVIEEE